tara:strand:- start:79578 stop:80255 length:678 start_codon:yes stop_codon:yes gene_type:complete
MNQDKLKQLQTRINYSFNDVSLLKKALTHKSAGVHNNERLEFLGDSIVGFVVADLLFHHHPKDKEGTLTRRRANLVNGRALAQMGKQFNLGDYLILGMGEMRSGGFRRESIIADCFEALVGAIYLDKGYVTCREKVNEWFAEAILQDAQTDVEKDAKTELQEWLQSQKMSLPVYVMSDVRGLQHEQIFTITLTVEGFDKRIETEGNSRRIAEQKAAKLFLEQVKK